ncbi:DUF6380 family protein [Streptomyces beijiangensis]
MDRDRSPCGDDGPARNSPYRRATLRSAAASLTATACCPHLDNRAEGEKA